MSLSPVQIAPRHSRQSGRSLETQKFNYDCQGKATETTNPWLEIIERNQLSNALLEKHRIVTVKFGNPTALRHDYQQAERLFRATVPNGLMYDCFLTCKRPDGSDIGVTMMPYYPMGSVYQYEWTPETFPLFMNVIKQTLYSMIEMYRLADGYVHPDLHLDNVLMRKTQKSELVYGGRRLPLQGVCAVIIDFEPRSTGTTTLPQAISKVLHLAAAVTFPNHILRNDAYKIASITREYPAIVDSLDDILDSYTLVPIPPMPEWS